MYPFECRLSKNSKEIDKKAFLCDQWKGKDIANRMQSSKEYQGEIR